MHRFTGTLNGRIARRPPRRFIKNAGGGAGSGGSTPIDAATSLLLHFNGTNGSTDFVDNGCTPHAPIGVGDVQISTAQSQFSGASGSFDGNDFISIPPSLEFEFDDDDFTIEFFVYLNIANTLQTIIAPDVLNSRGGARIEWDGVNGEWDVTFGLITGPNVSFSFADGAITTATWYHVALSRSGSSLRLFRDGVQRGSTETDSSPIGNNSGLRIGENSSDEAAHGLNGFLDELRIVTGIAIYEAPFSVPNAEFANCTTPNSATLGATQLLLKGNEPTGSQVFYDNSCTHKINTATADDAQTSEVQSRFGRASIEFDSTSPGDRISYGQNAAWNMYQGDFTIESFVRFNAVAVTMVLIASNTSDANFLRIQYRSASLDWRVTIAATTYIFPFVHAINTWYHVAVSRSGTDLRVFIDGVQIGVTETDNGNIEPLNGIFVGRNHVGDGGGSSIDGFLDDFRIVRGLALYTANFTPPATTLEACPENPITENTILQLHFDGANGSTNFVDSGILNKAGIAVGNAQISTAQSVIGGASGSFSSGEGFLSIGSHPAYALSLDHFTLECYVRFNDISNSPVVISADDFSALTVLRGGFRIAWDNPNLTWDITFQNVAGTIIDYTFTDAIAINTWYHVALVRQGHILRLFRDGNQLGTSILDQTDIEQATGLRVGRNWRGAGGDQQQLDGFVDELRLVRGRAVYDDNFTPPAAAFTNPATQLNNIESNSQAVLHLEGANGSTSFIQSGCNRESVGNVGNGQISTSQFQFGSSSYVGDGFEDAMRINRHNDWDFYTGNFTLEGFFRFNDVGVVNTLYAAEDASSDFMRLQWHGGLGSWRLTMDASTLVFTDSIAINTWYHIAVTRDGSDNRLFRDGVQIDATVVNSGDVRPLSDINIGRDHNGVGGAFNSFDGFIDEFRIVRGIAVYTSNFTPPTAPFPNCPQSEIVKA